MAIINYCIYTRRFVLKKINKEFEELMLTKTEGRMIEQLTVCSAFNHTSIAEFPNIGLVDLCSRAFIIIVMAIGAMCCILGT